MEYIQISTTLAHWCNSHRLTQGFRFLIIQAKHHKRIIVSLSNVSALLHYQRTCNHYSLRLRWPKQFKSLSSHDSFKSMSSYIFGNGACVCVRVREGGRDGCRKGKLNVISIYYLENPSAQVEDRELYIQDRHQLAYSWIRPSCTPKISQKTLKIVFRNHGFVAARCLHHHHLYKHQPPT